MSGCPRILIHGTNITRDPERGSIDKEPFVEITKLQEGSELVAGCRFQDAQNVNGEADLG
jgi:hypothetical protein